MFRYMMNRWVKGALVDRLGGGLEGGLKSAGKGKREG